MGLFERITSAGILMSCWYTGTEPCRKYKSQTIILPDENNHEKYLCPRRGERWRWS